MWDAASALNIARHQASRPTQCLYVFLITKSDLFFSAPKPSAFFGVADPGGGGLVCEVCTPPPPPIRRDACLRLKFFNRQDRTSLFNWLTFFQWNTRLHFAAKLNSRVIQKCYCLWSVSASACKTVFPAPTMTGVHRLRNEWSSLWEVIIICHKKSSAVVSEPKFGPPIKNSWIRPGSEVRTVWPMI